MSAAMTRPNGLQLPNRFQTHFGIAEIGYEPSGIPQAMILLSECASADLFANQTQCRARLLQVFSCLMNRRVVRMSIAGGDLDCLGNLFPANSADAICQSFVGAQFVTHGLVLCNRYGFPIAARSLCEFEEASEVLPRKRSGLAERATRKFGQRTSARRVELKMACRLRCVSLTGYASPARTKAHAPSTRLGGGPF